MSTAISDRRPSSISDRRPSSIEEIGNRLRLIRFAYSAVNNLSRPITQTQFANLCGISTATWNNAETADNRLGLDAGMAVARLTGVTLDYIYLGIIAGVSLAMAAELLSADRLRSTELNRCRSFRSSNATP